MYQIITPLRILAERLDRECIFYFFLGQSFFPQICNLKYSNNTQKSPNYASYLRSKISAKQDQINLRLCEKAFVVTDEIAEKIYRNNSHLRKNKIKIMPSGANTDLLKPLDIDQCRKYLKFHNFK